LNLNLDKPKSGFLDLLEEGDIDIGQDCENVSELPEENEVILGDQRLDEVLGIGKSDSVICKGVNKLSRQEVAIKIISKKEKTTAEQEDIRDSISILYQSQHHNVVRLEDHFECREYFYLCLELHSKLSLFDYINKYTK
jgi:serine/threonine protein kinase